MSTRIHPSSDVDPSAEIGSGTSVWHYAQIRESAVLGAECVVGRGAYIGEGVTLGNRCKVQNHALLYEPAEVGEGVFIGPGAIFTNDTYPRAITPEGVLKSTSDWTPTGVVVHTGASIGAHATCVAPVTIGEWAIVAAGAVVAHDVPAFALVAGVPARRIGWVGRGGRRLVPAEGVLVCPDTGDRFRENENSLTLIGADE